jgi:hypothetical protein
LDVTQGVDQLEFWDAPTGGNRLLPWGKNRMVKIYRIPVSGNFSEKVWISSTSQDATGPISFTLDILNNTGSIIAQTAKQNITVSQHSPVPYSLQDYLDTARIELARSGLSTAEQKVRLDVIKAAMSGLVPDIGDDRNPNLWDDSSGSYVARSGSSAVAAIDDIWIKHGADGIPSPPKIFCLKYSSLIMAEAYVMYFNSTGKAADVNQAKIAAINALIDHKVFPDELTNQGEGILWTSTTKEAGFQIRDLKPGDQVWFGNPYFTAEWKQKGWEMAKDHAINELGMSVADAEKYADNEIAGEGGSNVFYIGNGRVMSIYSKQVYTIAEYQQHIIDIFYTAKAAQANGKYVLLGDFQIKRVRSVVDPINL